MRFSIRVFALAAVAVFGLVLLAPSNGTAKKKRGTPSLLTYKAMVHIAGGVTFTSQHDTFKNCLPGQRWTLKEDSDVNMRGNLLIETYKNQQIRSGSIVDPGGAESKNVLASYEESNYCPPDEPTELQKPECDSLVGRGTVSLMPDPRRKGSKRVAIGFSRKTGGEQELDCTWGLGSRTTPSGFQMSQLGNVWASITLPLDIKISQLRSLGVKKSLIRTVRVGGSCAEPVLYRGKKIKSDTSNMSDGDCVADGDFVITIKRLNHIVKNQGVPVN